MTDLIETKTADLTGEALNWSVAKALGLHAYLAEPNYGNPHSVMIHGKKPGRFLPFQERYMPSEDWRQGGPLIEQLNIQTSYNGNGFSKSPTGKYWCAYVCKPNGEEERPSGGGPTPLIAACRAIVASVLGDTVSVPKELLS